MTLADLPGVNERLAPSFSEERPEEAGRYFARVEELFARHTVTTNQDKKLGVLKYLSLRSERLWMGVPAWADQTKTYDEFKAGVLRLYPQASDDATFTIHDLDATVGERARLGILNSNDLGDYYRDFLVISQYLVSKNRLSAAEQSRAFIRGFQPTLEQHIKQRLQLKKPDHNPQDTYELDDIYDAAAFVLMGTSPATLRNSPSATSPVAATASTSTDVKLEAILTMLERAFSGDSQQTGNRPRNTTPRSTDSTSVCNFCGVPGHFIRECEIGKVVLPSGAMVPREITGAWLRDRFDEYHARNPGQLGAAQMFFEMTAQIDKSKAVRFADDCPEDDEPGVYALRRQYVPRNRMPSRSLPMRGGVSAGPSESTTKSASAPHRDQPPHLSQPTTQGVSVTADDAEDVHPYAGAPDAVDNSDTTVGTTKPVPRPPFQRRSDQAYSTTAKIYDEGVARTVYDRVMDAPITVSQRELLSLAPELRTQVADATIRRRISRDFTQAMIEEIPEVEQKPDRSVAQTTHMPAAFATAARIPPANATIIADPYEAYLKSRLTNEQSAQDTIEVAAESNSLRAIVPTVDGQEKVEAILDPGCQIVAMSEEVCSALALPYDPTIRLNMVSANGGVNQSLGLARNVPFLVGEITLYLQVHILRSPAYDILLGRPFDILTQSVVRNYRDEKQTITILDPNTGKRATVPTIERGSYRFAERRKQVPKNPQQETDF
ncbi:hypothetical protein EDB84DRAFT_1268747 [Lactarius hengduanensis]|nr:hypothetical protein EDB84DRAFT_1268747 [Lactarius hengduanensis]